MTVQKLGHAAAPPPSADRAAAPASPRSSDADAAVPVSDRDPTRGRPDAPVTVVLFIDFDSPYSPRTVPVLAQLREKYGPEKVRIVFKSFPIERLFPASILASEAAQGVFVLGGNDGFWPFYDRLLEHPTERSRGSFLAWAKEVGVRDLARYERGLDDREWAAKVDKDLEVARRAGVDGAPVAFVNGVRESPVWFDGIGRRVDDELAATAKLLAEGTPPERMYAVRSNRNSADGKTKPERGLLRDRPRDAAQVAGTVYALPLGDAPAVGPKTALVTIVVFGDMLSGSCRELRARLDTLREEHPDDVRVVWRHVTHVYPVWRTDAEANFAIEARAEKGDDAFWAANARLCGDTRYDAPFDGLARELGLDAPRARSAVKARRHQSVIDADTEIAEDFGAKDQTLFVNGRKVVGEVVGIEEARLTFDEEVLARVLEEELNRARAKVREGVARDQLYAERMRGGAPPPIRTARVPLPATAPSVGPPGAKVVVQEFLPIPCSDMCRDNRRVFLRAMARFPGQVRLVVRPLARAFQPLQAEAAMEGFAQRGSAAFFALVDGTAMRDVSRRDLDDRARRLGVDPARWAAALDEHTHADALAAAAAAAASAGIRDHALVIGDLVTEVPSREARYQRLLERAIAAAR